MTQNKQINRTIIKTIIIIFLLTSNIFAQSIQCQPGEKDNTPKRIAWFAGTKGTGFWPMVEKLLQASANDLGVTLEVYYTNDPIKYIDQVKKVLNRIEKPIDGILFHNHKHRGEKLLDLAEKKGIPAMMFNAGFSKSNTIGKPRENYSCWIGKMLPNDELAGFQLAQALLLEAKKHPNMIFENKIHMVALEGDRASSVSTLRLEGMKRAIKHWEEDNNNPKVILEQTYHSKWRRNLAAIAFKLTQSRYPQVSVYWTAADVMAMGILDAAKELNKTPGKDFVTGGMDLLPKTLDHLEKGNITASVGAHYIEGVFALIALYDYLNGYDFATVGPTEFLTKMAIKIGKPKKVLQTDDETIQQHLNLVDFSLLSNAYKGYTQPYKLDTQKILDKLWQ